MTEQSLLDEAFALPPAKRAAFLSAACAGQPELRASVEARLAAWDESGQPGPAPVVDDLKMTTASNTEKNGPPPLVATASYHRLNAQPGAMIAGRYTLQEKIGEGGMGEVWVAKQTEPVKRKVAVKLIKTGMDSRAVLTRFEQERQALAMMDHPNIARVLDGGMTQSGQPFFVMEIVNGLALNRFCDEAKLTPRERLELFVPICQAIQHAHQKGIVHRDLKPANILITLIDGRPVPKVIDFGVAKATGGKLTEETLSTGFGAVVGTLEYMSPEQAGFSGVDIDTRADIYSLGVILYELLTGLRPIDAKRLKQAAFTEMIRIIQDDEPSKPSTRLSTDESLPSLAALRQTEPRRLMAMLRGELDWIVMKCLEKSRERRYETVNGLARDIQRYLANEPVEARPPSAGYRMQKFLQRNKRTVAAGLLLLLTLIAGIIGTSWGLVRSRHAEAAAIRERNDKELARQEAVAKELEANRQKELARDGFQQARQAVDRAFTVVSENRLLQVPGLQPLRKQLLEEALHFYRTFATEWAREPTLRRDLSQAYFRVAAITGEIGSKTQAVADYAEAIKLYELLLREDPDDVEVAQALATCHNNVGTLLMDQQKYAESLAALERCRDLRQNLASRQPINPDSEDGLASIDGNLAIVLNILGRTPEAFERLDAALEIGNRRLSAAPQDSHRRHEVAGLLDNRGGLLTRDGRYEEAARAFREAITQEQLAVKANPTAVNYQAFLGKHYFNLALVCENYLQRPTEALAARTDAVGVWEKLATENPAVTEYRANLAQGCLNLANILQFNIPSKENPLPWYQRAHKLFDSLTRELPEVPNHHSSLGAVLDGLGSLQATSNEFAQARQSLEEAIDHQRKAIELAPDNEQYHRFLASHLMNLSRVYSHLQQTDKVMATLRAAVPVLERVVRDSPDSADHWKDLGSAHHTLGQLLAADGHQEEALQAHRRAVTVWQQQVLARPDDESSIDTLAGAIRTLASDLVDADRGPEAASLREEEVRFWQDLKPKTQLIFRATVAQAVACLERGELAAKMREWNIALEWFETSRAVFKSASSERPDDLDLATLLARACKWIGDVYYVLQEPAKAGPAWEESLAIYRNRLSDAPADTGRQTTIGGLLHNLGRLHGDAGDHGKALECFREAVRHQKIAFAENPESCRQWLDNHYFMLAWTLRELKSPEESVATVRERIKLWPEDPQQQVRAVGELAQCIPLVATDELHAKQWGDECLALLKQSVQRGFDSVTLLKKEPVFDALRTRDDFQKLVAELEKRAAPP